VAGRERSAHRTEMSQPDWRAALGAGVALGGALATCLATNDGGAAAAAGSLGLPSALVPPQLKFQAPAAAVALVTGACSPGR
jgi:hypothetical protein